MHLCQEGNEKLFRLHIRRTDKFAEVDVGPDGEGVGVPLAQCFRCRWKTGTLNVANLAPNESADQRWWDDSSA
jgi:hypothetical protein